MKSVVFNNKKLYYQGNIDILDYDSVGVVGTRKPSTESINFTKEHVSVLCKEKVIVSGLALGIDKVAHETCIDNDGLTIAVLPSGLDCIYPLKHKPLVKNILANDGLIVSQYAPNKRANRRTFIERDHLIAELSDELLVPQCNFKSGTMHTVNFARELDKKITVQDADYTGNRAILNTYINSFPL